VSQAEKKFFNSNDARFLITHYGFALFPIHGIVGGRCTCGKLPCGKPDSPLGNNAGKHPATDNGCTDATKDIEQLKKLWAGRKNLNVGIATGAASNIFVVDIDGAEGELDVTKLGELPTTLTVKTGRGRHLFFKYPGYKISTRTKVIGNKVDIRGDGGYVAGPGSNHASGAVYEWVNPLDDIVEAPEWLLDAAIKEKDSSPLMSAPAPTLGLSGPRLFVSNSWTESDLCDMLSFLSADCSYDEWIELGMAFKDGGGSFSGFDRWSQSAPHRYDPKSIQSHWKSFRAGGGRSVGTLVKKAQDHGWMRVSPESDRPQPKAINMEPAAKEPVRLKFTGLIGDTIQDILATTQQQQPELAMLNVFAALGAVYGRRYCSPINTRTNLYTVGVAHTGAGKDHSRKYIKALLLKSGLDSFLGSDSLVSGAGLIASVEKKPSQIMMLDEFGMLLADIKNKNTSSHLKICSKILTEFYSASNSFYYGGQYADKGLQPTKINSPNLCIYGTTTLSKYTEALDRSVVESGELNRYIIIKPQNDWPARVKPPKRTEPAEAIIGNWSVLAPMFGNNSASTEPPIMVKWDWVEDRIWDIQLFQDDKVKLPVVGALWARYAENVIKIAMIMAISRSLLRPEIDVGDIDMAELLVRQSVDFMVSIANTQMHDSVHEKECNKVLEVVKKYGEKMPKRELSNRTREMTSKTRDEVIKSLQDRGAMFVESAKNISGVECFMYTAT